MKYFKIKFYGNVAICNNREFNSLLEESIQYSFPELGFKKVNHVIHFNKEKGNLNKFLEKVYEEAVDYYKSDILDIICIAAPERTAREQIDLLRKEIEEEG